MTHKDQLKAIHDAYAELPEMQDGFFDVRDRLLDMNAIAERQHRKGAPNGIRHGISVNTAAKLFVVSHLLDGWREPDKWSVEHILHIRTECLYAQAYAKNHHAELKTWAEKWAPIFRQDDRKERVDYAELMRVGR